MGMNGGFEMEDDEKEALERFQAWQALQELKRRYPEPEGGYPCPACGSMDHFEC